MLCIGYGKAASRVRGLYPHEQHSEWREPLIRRFAPPSPTRGEERNYDPPPAVPEFTGASSSSRQRQPSAAFTKANVRWILRRRVTLKAAAARSLLVAPACGRPVPGSQQVPVQVVATLLQAVNGASTTISISPVTCAS